MEGKQPFDIVVATHGPTVLRVCRAVLGPADADDAWSETFLSAMKAYPGLPAEANIEAWLVTIAHRKAIDVTRAAARRAIPVAEMPGRAARRRHAADSRDLDLVSAVARLPAKQRQAVAYHYLAGLPYTGSRRHRWQTAPTPPVAQRPTASPPSDALTRAPL